MKKFLSIITFCLFISAFAAPIYSKELSSHEVYDDSSIFITDIQNKTSESKFSVEFLTSIDKKIVYLFNNKWRNSFFDKSIPIITELAVFVIVFTLFLYLLCLFTGKNNKIDPLSFSAFILLLLVSYVVTDNIVDIIKVLADRPRPYQVLPEIFYMKKAEWLRTSIDIIPKTSGSSFVSAHAAKAMVVACAFYFYFGSKFSIFFLVPLIVSWSRLYLGRHYFSDVVSGCLVGFLISYAIFKLLQKNFPKYYK